MEKKENFYTYLKGLNNNKSFSDNLIDCLTNFKFKIIGNQNSHDYNRFLNKDNLLVFNNIDNASISSSSITHGCINSKGGSGNTLRFDDIMPILTYNKIDILKKIEQLNKEIESLENEKKEKLSQLEFLNKTNKEILVNEEFEEFVLDVIVKEKV